MEKNIKSLTNLFIGIGYEDAIDEVVRAGRRAKNSIETFAKSRNGCILVMMVPLCQQADTWLGGLSEFDDTGRALDLHEYVFARTITPGGSHTIQWVDPKDNHVEPVNCFAYATMKIAYLSHLIKDNISDRDHDETAQGAAYYCEVNGYSSHRGAVCVTVYYADQLLMRFYIVFSGATEDEDLQCALETARHFCRYLDNRDPNFRFALRTVDGAVDWQVEEGKEER